MNMKNEATVESTNECTKKHFSPLRLISDNEFKKNLTFLIFYYNMLKKKK
jgi:hypothetical protein